MDQYRTHAADKLALAGDDAGLRSTILNIRDESSSAAKAAHAEAYIAHLARDGAPDAVIALARDLLSGPLLKGRAA